MNRTVLILLFSLFTVILSRNVEIENFKRDPNAKSDDFFDFGTLRLKKVAKNQYSISGEFELLENSGNEKELLLEVTDKNNKKVLIRSQDKFCDFLKKDEFIWPDIKEKSNFPSDDPCPMPKGKYWIKDFIIDEKKFSMVPPGEYVGRFAASQNDKLLAAVDVPCKVTP